jgi:hypothetical protein
MPSPRPRPCVPRSQAPWPSRGSDPNSLGSQPRHRGPAPARRNQGRPGRPRKADGVATGRVGSGESLGGLAAGVDRPRALPPRGRSVWELRWSIETINGIHRCWACGARMAANARAFGPLEGTRSCALDPRLRPLPPHSPCGWMQDFLGNLSLSPVKSGMFEDPGEVHRIKHQVPVGDRSRL